MKQALVVHKDRNIFPLQKISF